MINNSFKEYDAGLINMDEVIKRIRFLLDDALLTYNEKKVLDILNEAEKGLSKRI